MKGRLGGLMNSGMSRGDTSAWESRRQSGKGFYETRFVETYDNLTERDLDLLYDYGIDLVRKFTGEPKKTLSLSEKKNKQTVLGRNEVYYVKRGVDIIGKLSISYRATPNERLSATYIYQEKKLTQVTRSNYYDKTDKKRRNKQNSTGRKAQY